jgi:hypothetical protein
MPTRGMYDTWISGSDVNSFCCIPSGFVVVFEKPNRSSFTFTVTSALAAVRWHTQTPPLFTLSESGGELEAESASPHLPPPTPTPHQYSVLHQSNVHTMGRTGCFHGRCLERYPVLHPCGRCCVGCDPRAPPRPPLQRLRQFAYAQRLRRCTQEGTRGNKLGQ